MEVLRQRRRGGGPSSSRSPGARRLRRVLIVLFELAFWWLNYRESSAKQRRRTKQMFTVAFGFGIVAFAVHGDALLALLGCGWMVVTLGILRLVDLDLARTDADERAHRRARREGIRQQIASERDDWVRGSGHGGRA